MKKISKKSTFLIDFLLNQIYEYVVNQLIYSQKKKTNNNKTTYY